MDAPKANATHNGNRHKTFSNPTARSIESEDQVNLKANRQQDLDFPFTDWLKGGEKIYWICGKAGSGKSTLMNFICGQSERTELLLGEWSCGRDVICPKFFFWQKGRENLRKGVPGLLRSLLYQISSTRPDLTDKLRQPGDLADTDLIPTWSEPRLMGALIRILETEDRPNICFFLDGLDEVDGKPETLLQLLTSLRSFPRIKICVSSRPELVFENHLNRLPMLRLEDMTQKDMKIYVDKRLQSMTSGSSDLQGLISQIVEKAHGIFIWVRFAVDLD